MKSLHYISGYFLWPSWRGCLIRWEVPQYLPSGRIEGPKRTTKWYKPNVVWPFHKCSHGTARQFRINWWRWSWYIVLRNHNAK